MTTTQTVEGEYLVIRIPIKFLAGLLSVQSDLNIFAPTNTNGDPITPLPEPDYSGLFSRTKDFIAALRSEFGTRKILPKDKTLRKLLFDFEISNLGVFLTGMEDRNIVHADYRISPGNRKYIESFYLLQ